MDISEEDLRAYLQALNANTEALGRASDPSRRERTSRDPKADTSYDSIKRFSTSLNSYADSVASAVKGITGGADALIGEFQSLARKVAGGAIIAQIVGAGYDLTKTYRQLVDVGQSFGGSMAEMIKQSGEAGVPLAEFGRMLERNSIAAKSLEHQTDGSKMSLGLLAKSVRDAAVSQNLYGMSVAQINDLTGDYAESLRLTGRAATVNKEATSKQINALAKDITDFSDATGKSRTQIMESMREVTHTATFAAASAGLNAEQTKAHMTAIAGLTALPNGKQLADQLEETMAAGGAIYTEMGKRAAEAGVPEFIGIFDEMRQKILSGHFDARDANDSLKQFQDIIKKTGLSVQAYQAQNPAAKQLFEMLAGLNGVTLEAFNKQQEISIRWGKLTGFFLKLEDQLNRLGSSFAVGFGDAIADLEKTFDDGGDVFAALRPQLESLGRAFGDFIKKLLEPGHLQAVITGLVEVAKGAWVVVQGLGAIGLVVSKAIGYLETFGNWFNSWTNGSGKSIVEAVGGVILSLWLFSKVLKTVMAPFRFARRMFDVGGVTHRPGAGGGGAGAGGPHEPAHPGGGGGRGGRFGAVGRVLGNVAGSFLGGGGDCCDNLMGGLDALRDRVDFHGERAHTNAREGMAEEAARPHGSAAERAGARAARTAEGMSGRLGALARGALGRVAGVAERASGLLARGGALGHVLRGGAAGLATMGAEMAIDRLVPEGTRGKHTAESALEWGGQGAFIGSLIAPGIGTAIGGALGAALGAGIANWDSIKGAVGLGPAAATAPAQANAVTGTEVIDAKRDHILGGSSANVKPATPVDPNAATSGDSSTDPQARDRSAVVSDIANATKDHLAATAATSAEMLKQIQQSNLKLEKLTELAAQKLAVDSRAQTKQADLTNRLVNGQIAQYAGGIIG